MVPPFHPAIVALIADVVEPARVFAARDSFLRGKTYQSEYRLTDARSEMSIRPGASAQQET